MVKAIIDYLTHTRPTEALTGPALAVFLYGFLTEAGVSTVLAAIAAVVIAFVPLAVSEVVEDLRR